MKRILILFYCLCPMVLFGQGILSTLEGMHSVVKGETWESVAANYGVSIMELQAANPDVKRQKLKKGTLLIIPKKQQQISYVPVSEVPEKPLRVIRTVISDLKVGVMLPLSDKKMVEFYRGLLMAADSIRKDAKVNLDIHAWDCGTSVSQIEALLPQLSGLDIIFGPASSSQMPIVAENCREQGTRLVLPFWNGQASLDYPLVYSATAPIGVFFDTTVKKMLSFSVDGITSFSVAPLKFISVAGILMTLVALVVMIYALISYSRHNVIQGWTSILISLWFIGGVVTTGVGITGIYIGKIYTEVKRRPRYFIEERLNL